LARAGRARAAAAADEEFSAEFLTAARKVFQMIDDDDSGTLEKAEIVTAVRANREVIKFLTDCGNKNLQHLLVPSRLESALAQMDTDHDGTIDADEWEECIEKALANKLEQRAAAREAQSKAALKEIAEFTGEFLSAAQRCFELIDKDGGGSLSIDEIVDAVKNNAARTRRPTTARPSTCEDSAELLFSCVRCVVVRNRTTASHFVSIAGGHKIHQQLRRRQPDVPAPPAAPQEGPLLP
jgi:hypothetical protein